MFLLEVGLISDEFKAGATPGGRCSYGGQGQGWGRGRSESLLANKIKTKKTKEEPDSRAFPPPQICSSVAETAFNGS